ncbi:DNA-3-methyladenine glycosylase 2 family protein [Pedobacter sp. PF22-3]|uniref:DNA-3-methyladenine glycosylase family protein n=1 Tax=Pedobacter sp. PF22-3 TaxID=2994467 RepID=UPI002247A9AD|nr:DNA-3-methyladenine glycosylase 2 family protein [Pedobacter sp. PF22-3]MCX2492395.1 DNA-3-methyladenine glycosylase 2 family protein [Pedobacter sp. PF22-3]
MFETFDQTNFHQLCDLAGKRDADLQVILNRYGYPPFWSRPNTFESLVHVILEQQVSLASALATLNKLKEKIKDITPVGLLLLTDQELRDCYFSRQKTAYVRHLAENIVSGTLSLSEMEKMDDLTIRNQLKSIKGIGDWTVDIYLIFMLHHKDIFPIGDLAAVNSLKKIKGLAKGVSKEEIFAVANQFKPYRTIATMLLWHAYLEERKKK